MPMIDGAMQSYRADPRQVPGARREVASARRGGDRRARAARVDRVGYAELERRARKVSVVLAGFGVRAGDRVATLAWNTQAHLEVWYAIMGMGAVCHTLNPRLTCRAARGDGRAVRARAC